MNQEPSNQVSKTDYQVAKAKGWDVKEKVKRSIGRVTEGIRTLIPFLPRLDPNATKRQILAAARAQLEAGPGLLTCPRYTLHFVIAAFSSALKVDGGKLLSIETAWNTLIDRLSVLDLGVASALNTPEHKAAFGWQLAGLAAACWSTADFGPVLIYENRLTNAIEHRLLLENGEEVPMPADFAWSLPVFLPQGSHWKDKLVSSDSLGNVTFESSYAPLDDALRSAIWEPKAV